MGAVTMNELILNVSLGGMLLLLILVALNAMAAYIEYKNFVETIESIKETRKNLLSLKELNNEVGEVLDEESNTLEEHKLMTFNHNLWVDCSELIDILNYELWR